jgi:hypothetical protein
VESSGLLAPGKMQQGVGVHAAITAGTDCTVLRCTPAVQILPTWLTTVALSLLLAFVTVNLLWRGVATYRIETLRIKRALRTLGQPPLPKQAGTRPSITVDGNAGSDSSTRGAGPPSAVSASPAPTPKGPGAAEGRQPSSVAIHVDAETAGGVGGWAGCEGRLLTWPNSERF